MVTPQGLALRELAIREQELELKRQQLSHERRKTIWLSAPLTLAVVGGIFALSADYVIEDVKSRHMRGIEALKAQQNQEAHMLAAALDLVKQAAAPGAEVEHTRRFLQFVLDVEIGPLELRNRLQAYLNKPDAQLPPALPTVAASTPMVISVGQPSATRALPSNQPAGSGETGWFYLGKSDVDIKRWVGSSAVGTFEILPNDGRTDCPKDVTAATKGRTVAEGDSIEASKLIGKTIRTLGSKYLRGAGAPGERVRSPVARTMPPGTILRITALDDKGRDDRLPVLWAEVEVCKRPAG